MKHIRTIEDVKARCIINQNGCWIWQGLSHISIKKNSKPYALITYFGRPYYGGRVIFAINKHEFKAKEIVCHKCDESLCMNPEHLYIGTQKDNVRDMYERNRQSKKIKETCKRGHRREGENLKIRTLKDGRIERVCRLCKKITDAKHAENRIR